MCRVWVEYLFHKLAVILEVPDDPGQTVGVFALTTSNRVHTFKALTI